MKRYRRVRLTESHRSPPDLFKEYLAPLMRGEIVKLAVDISKKHGQTVRQTKQLVLIAPGSTYNMRPGLLVISVIGKGSCILNPKTGKGVGELTKAGLPIRLAAALFEKLIELFGDDNGTTTSK